MKKFLRRIRSIGENILYEIVDYLSAFACMGTVIDNRVCVTLIVVSLIVTIFVARNIPWN